MRVLTWFQERQRWIPSAAQVAGCFGLLVLAACQPEAAEVPAPADTESARTTGSLEGFVRLAGETIPAPPRVEITADPMLCGPIQTLEDLVVSTAGRGIKNVIVALADVPAAKVPSYVPGRLELDNHACRFVPRVSVVTVGSTIVATNSDAVLHNQHFYGVLDANVALPFKGTTVSAVARKPGMIIIRCDVHGWMQAYVRVDPHPFHAVTDEAGYFRIRDIPTGRYRLEIWQQKLGQQDSVIDITAARTAVVEIQYSQ